MISAHLSAVSRWHNTSGLEGLANYLPGAANAKTLRLCVNHRPEMLGVDGRVLVIKHLG
jgi:hypothetical protein